MYDVAVRSMDGRSRALLHAGYALSAMVACGLWFATMGEREWIEFRVARAVAIGSVAALSVELGLALASLRTMPWLTWICAALELVVAAAWIQLTGSASSYLLPLVALLVLCHRAIEGKRAGICSWLLALALMIATVVLERASVLPYASVYIRSLPQASTPPFVWAALGATLLLQSAALGLGWLLAPSEPLPHLSGREVGRRVGQLLDGKYRLGRLIGYGGMGEVYAARCVADRARVAVKVLRAHLAGDAATFERWRREADALARLASSRIARVLDSGTAAGVPYIVMELLRGEDLSSCLKKQRRLPLVRVVAIVEQVAEALDAAASIGVVHRDVKPRNIFLVRGRADDARLLDFGLCRLQDAALSVRATRTAALVGTPGYFAPEQVAEGFGEVGPPTDVFALGAVAYRALTGERSFPSRQAAAAVYEVLNHQPPPAKSLTPSLPEEIDLVLAVALAKDPKDRYATAGQLARDLRAASQGALPEAAIERARRILRQRASSTSTITTAA